MATPLPRKSRRQFLATSLAAAGALPLARSAHAAGSGVLRIGLVGCGGRGCGAAVNALLVNPSARLVAMADAFADRLQSGLKALRARSGSQVAVTEDRCFSGLDACKRLLASGVDVALLAEPPHFRPMHIEACVEAGVHLFAEKPMAVDAPGARRVLAAGEKARQKNLSFVSGFETRYSPSAREAIRRVHDNQIGRVLAIHTTYNTGSLWHRGRQPEWTEMEFQMRNWYYFTWLSGDHLVEQHVHYNDVICWLMHEEPPVSAWGYGGRQVRTEAKYGDIFDHHAVVYDYADGTRVFCYTRQQPGCYNENSKMVLGTAGRLRDTRGWVLEDLAGNSQWTAPATKRHPELTCFEEMFAAIRAGKPINDSLTMARSTMHAILGRMATHSGQRVTWDQAWQSKQVLAPASYAWNAQPPVVPGPDGNYPRPMPGVTRLE